MNSVRGVTKDHAKKGAEHARRPDLPVLPCLCGNLRRAARLLSLAYESAPGWPGELSVAQFSLLQAIALSGRISHSGLAWLLGLDQTTVSRSLADLGARGLVHVIRGEDRRERFVALTAGGERAFRRAELVWRRVQGDIRQRCGARRTERLERLLTELSVIAAVSSR